MESVDLLAEVSRRLKKLVAHMKKTYPTRENVNRLKKILTKRVETLPNSYTSLVKTKARKLLCLEEKKGENKLIDLNTLHL